MEDDTWISMHRKFKDWQWYKNINVKTLFIHLLLKANFKDNYWKDIEIKRGQVLTSIEHLSQETGLSVQQIRTAINKLKSTGEITIEATSKYSLITVEKYNIYQKNDKKITNKITNNVTINQQTNNKQVTTNNKDNNNNNIYLYLFNIYKAKIQKSNFGEKVRVLSELKEDKKYELLSSENQDKLFYELMSVKKE
ncbi:MAG: hypothetical protein HFJ48_01600 [Clostridia bacterium]|nr:hypothetical protein [Clostridia bacterium]